MNPLSTLFAQLETQAATPTPNPSVAEPQQGRTGLAPHTLLVRVANLLGVAKDSLLEQGFIEPCDLEEQAHADPLAIAALIRSDPRWGARDRSTGLTRIKTHHSVAAVGQGTPQAHAIHWTAQIAPVEWTQARDAYLNHLAACPDCWAPIGRYCTEGKALHQHYQSQPKEPCHD